MIKFQTSSCKWGIRAILCQLFGGICILAIIYLQQFGTAGIIVSTIATILLVITIIATPAIAAKGIEDDKNKWIACVTLIEGLAFLIYACWISFYLLPTILS